jgi:hypothetical protein
VHEPLFHGSREDSPAQAKQLEPISQLRRLGKKDVAAWVSQLEG